MNHPVHVLELRKDIVAPPEGTAFAPDGTADISEYRSLVPPGELEPKPESHLAPPPAGSANPIIPAGFYLFTQAPYPQAEADRKEAYRAAAEALWLESLWRGARLKNDRVLVRTLSEDGKTVFQAFREIEAPTA